MHRTIATLLFGFLVCVTTQSIAQSQAQEIVREAPAIASAPVPQDNGHCQNARRHGSQVRHHNRPMHRFFHKPPSHRHPVESYSNSPYPKYYGAFHSSHFSNLGVPTGDIGFRGNSIFWSPW